MKTRRSSKRHVHLWLLMAGVFTLILTVIVAVMILAYRFFLANSYEDGLHRQLANSYELLRQNEYSKVTARRLSAQGIHVLLIDEAEDGVLFRDTWGLQLNLGPRQESGEERAPVPDNAPRPKATESLRELVLENLGQSDGSFYATDLDRLEGNRRLDSKVLYLCGRDGSTLFCLYLPVESTNAAITLAIRYTTIISLAAWILCMVLLYFLSKAITRPHRKIAATAAQIAELDFSQRCPEALTVELNELSGSINAMADSLEANVEALQSANEQLQTELSERIRQQKITAELIANLSHDLKTPISIISGYAEGLLEGVARTPEKQQTYYGMIQRESDHMLAIVSRILALGRMESGETPIQLEDFDLTRMLDELIDSFERELERLELRLDRVGYRPCMVRTDYSCARQSLLNYIQNAIYHINNGNHIEVRLTDLGSRVRVRVANSSAPIPEEEAARLWDKLYRGDPSRQRHNGEMGLGLAIVKGNMERLGHSYGFENDPAFPGVAFWVEFPKPEAAEDDPQTTKPRANPGPAQRQNGAEG